MRINLHVIVIGAGLTGSFFLKEMIAYLHMKQENPGRSWPEQGTFIIRTFERTV